MYQNETRDVILQRLLGRLDPNLDRREGSVSHDMLAPVSIEFENLYQLAETILDLGFADTTNNEFLDLRCAEVGIYRKLAVKASGTVTFTGSDGVLIPSGTMLSTGGDNPSYFLTTADGTILNGSVDIHVEAELGGVHGNILSNSISHIIGDLALYIEVENSEPFIGGIEEETDEELLERYFEKVLSPITSGNEAHYLVWAKEVSGVGDALIQALHYGNGTVRVLILDSERTPAEQPLLDAVKNHIETLRPIGATVYVESATGVAIDVAGTLTLQAGYSLSTVLPSIENSITDYLKNLAFRDSIVRYSQIANVILDTEGVLDYTNLVVNGTTGNIQVGDEEVAVKGVVNLNV